MPPQTFALNVEAHARDDHLRPLDEALVEQVIAGSQEALAAIYDQHANAIHATASRASGDPGVAADIVQETFLALWNRAERFDPARGSLRAWLQTIARNRAIDHRRAAFRHHRAATFSSFGHEDDRAFAEWLAVSGELVGSAAPDLGPDDIASNHEVEAAVTMALATLSPDERTAIGLAYGHGMSQSEIATALAVPLGTVKTRTRRALQRLREALAWVEADRRPDTARSTTPVGGPASGRIAFRATEAVACLSAKC